MRQKAGICLMTLGLAMILSAMGLILANRHQEEESRLAAAQAEEAVEEQIVENIRREEPAAEQLAENSRQEELVPSPQYKELPVEIIENYPYIGTLRIPVLGLELPVMDSWTMERLYVAPCRQYGTNARDLVIAGHNYKFHFGRLRHLVPGDRLSFTDMDGEETVYEVETVETILPTQSDRVLDPQWDLVLYTCTYGANTRIMAACKAVEAAASAETA